MASNENVSPCCPLCSKLYKEPLILQCLHSFCKKCLQKYVDKEGIADRKVRCPSCGVNSKLPSDGIAGFPQNLRLNHLSEMMGYQKRMEDKVSCDRCTNNAAISFCCNCCWFMCESCVADHQRWRELQSHELVPLDMAKKANNEGEKLFKIQYPAQPCPEHTQEDLRFYCKQCEVLVCRDCLVTTHEGHKRDSLDKVAEAEREEMRGMVESIQEALAKLDEAIKQGVQKRQEVQGSQKEVTNQIDAISEKLKQTVEARRKTLLKRCEDIAQSKDDVLANQIQEFKGLKETISFISAQLFDAIYNHSSEELLSVKKAIKLQVQKMMDNFQLFSLELRENQAIGTSLDIGALEGSILSLGYFPGVPEAANSSIEGLTIPEAIVDQERKFKIILKDEKNQPIQGDALFQYKIVQKNFDDDAPLPKVTVTQSEAKDGTATLSVTLQAIGEYTLIVMVRNEPITKDPFCMWAHQPRDYKALPDPTPLKTETSQIPGIAVHSSGDIYVTDHNKHCVLVLKPDGTQKQCIGGNDNAGGNLSNPLGITLANEAIYVASYGTHKIKMYAWSGECIGEFGEEGTGDKQLKNPFGICSDNNGHIVVADHGNCRVQIFTTDGNPVRSIPCGTNPYNVAIDNEHNIHVTLYSNNNIQIFSWDGQKGATYNAGGKMRSPWGIDIDVNGYKMITEAGNNLLRILGPDGGDITTRQGFQRAVARDRDGYIYVAETSNPQIQKI